MASQKKKLILHRLEFGMLRSNIVVNWLKDYDNNKVNKNTNKEHKYLLKNPIREKKSRADEKKSTISIAIVLQDLIILN